MKPTRCTIRLPESLNKALSIQSPRPVQRALFAALPHTRGYYWGYSVNPYHKKRLKIYIDRHLFEP